jgi:hypothetical protein
VIPYRFEDGVVNASVRAFGAEQPVLVELDVLDRLPAERACHVDVTVAGLMDARVGVLARIRFQMQRRFPGPSLIERTGDTERRPNSV